LPGTPNTPRQATKQPPSAPRSAVASYAVLDSHCLVGRARQPIGRRQTSWRALPPPGWPRLVAAGYAAPCHAGRRQCKLARARARVYFDNSLFRFYSTVVKCASQLASRQHRRCLLWCLNHSTTTAQCTFYC
jgi:hypothetical protein